MDRLTRGEIEDERDAAQTLLDASPEAPPLILDRLRFKIRLCDLALQSLSQEAVREEVLEEAIQYVEGRKAGRDSSQEIWREISKIANGLRALKREPNAAPTREESRQDWDAVLSDGPAPAAPDEQDDKEIGEFQQRVYELCEKFYPYVDGAGSDTGDWRDFTLAEIRQTLNHLAERPPSGEMVMVPREPTQAMRAAGYQQYVSADKRGYSAWQDHLAVYRAMLSAAEAEGRKS